MKNRLLVIIALSIVGLSTYSIGLITGFYNFFPVPQLIDLKNDFENLSALLKNLDVVVSPTSAIMSHADACDVRNISYTSYVFDKALGNIVEERFIKIPWLTNNKVFIFGELNKRQVLDEIISEVRALVDCRN